MVAEPDPPYAKARLERRERRELMDLRPGLDERR